MTEAVCVQKKPYAVELEAGDHYWCACGLSKKQPFCDGSHATAGFDGTETASRASYDEQADQLSGPVLTLNDARGLCAGARFCDRAGTVWTTVGEISDAADRAAFVSQVGQCPSGRLVARDSVTGETLEPDFRPSIVLVEDPSEGVRGPVWVRGGLSVIASDGSTYEVRNRVTLCRCGASANKPFCDGSHFQSVGERDP